MRRYLWLFLLAFCPLPAHASIAFVSASATACTQTSSTTKTATCTLAASTSGTNSGRTIVVAVADKTNTSVLNSVTGSATCQFFVRSQPYKNSTPSAVIQFATAQDCPALSTVTVNMSANGVFVMGVLEYSGVASIGRIANTSTQATNTHPAQSLTIQDANNYFVVMTGSLGNLGIPTAGTGCGTTSGNLRLANRTGSTSSHVALGMCDNTAASGAISEQDTITSGAWVAIGLELRTANPADPLLVQAVASSTDAGLGVHAGNDYVFPFPQLALSGNAFICGMAAQSGKTYTITDDLGNTWTIRGTATGAHDDAIVFDSVGSTITGASKITVHANTAFGTSGEYSPHVKCKELNNINSYDSTAGAKTAVTQTGPNIATASITGSQDNDIYFEFVGSDLDFTVAPGANGVQLAPYITPGSGFSLIDPDVVFGECFQDFKQGTAAAVTPSCDVENANPYNAVSVAYKTDSSGTAAPATGLHIDHQATYVLNLAIETSRNIQIAADGNFLSYATTNSNAATYATADSHQNSYTASDLTVGNSTAFVYAANSTVDVSQMIHIAITSSGGNEVVVRDIRGAKTSSPIGCQSPVTTAGSQTVPTSGPTTVNNAPGSYTPCAAGDLLIWDNQNGNGPPGNLSGPSGAVTDSVWYTGQVDGSTYDLGEGHGHYFTTGTSSINFTLVMQNNQTDCGCMTNSWTVGVWEISPIPAAAVTPHAPPMIAELNENK